MQAAALPKIWCLDCMALLRSRGWFAPLFSLKLFASSLRRFVPPMIAPLDDHEEASRFPGVHGINSETIGNRLNSTITKQNLKLINITPPSTVIQALSFSLSFFPRKPRLPTLRVLIRRSLPAFPFPPFRTTRFPRLLFLLSSFTLASLFLHLLTHLIAAVSQFQRTRSINDLPFLLPSQLESSPRDLRTSRS